MEYQIGSIKVPMSKLPTYLYNHVGLKMIEHTCIIISFLSTFTEEIFIDTKKAYWVSTDGSHLLYATFNDSIVQNLEYPWVQDDLQNKDLLKFPATKSVRYPTVSE